MVWGIEIILDSPMIDFFVNNVKWTANTRGDAKAISVIPDQDTGTVEVNIPIIPSGARAPLKRRQVSYNETGTASGTGGTPVTTGGSASIDAIDFPLVLENGNIMALTSSQDPSVPVLVITSHRRIGINQDAPVATLDIAKGNNATALPIMKFEAGPLVAAPVNGSFEYDTAGDIYFTSNGVRKYFVLNSNSSSAVKKLESSSNPGKFLTLTGGNDVVLNGTAGVTLNLPSANGTVARLEDLGTLPPSSVDGSEIANASITNLKLAPDAVTTDNIPNGTIIGADLASNTIVSGNISDGTISLSDLSTAALNALDSKKLTSSNVGALSGQAITFDGLHNAVFQSNGANVNLLLPAGSGTLARLSDITAPGTGSIGSALLADGAVTSVKLATDAVTSNKILDGTITGADLANATITNVDIASNTVNSGNILDATIQAADLADGSVTNNKIVSVDASKITGSIPVSLNLAKGVLASTVLDFTPDHSFFTKTMTANTTFTAVNLKQGSRYVLKLSGSFIPTFPSFFVLNPDRSYNPQLQNYFQFEVIDDSVGSPLVIVRLNQQPL